jgi:AraC-like DNA-binding protein
VPAVALLSPPEGNAGYGAGGPTALARAVLSLGRCGVERLVDVRTPGGWHELRELLARDGADGFERFAAETVVRDLAGAPPDCLRFFQLLFRAPPGPATVRTLARELGVVPSTLMSRFFRARLPAPKRYLALARLVRAARLFENPGLSVAAVANALEYSSPQSFGRHVRTVLHVTAVRFRERYDGEGMLQRFREELVLPYLPALRRFTPLAVPPGWLGEEGRRRMVQ